MLKKFFEGLVFGLGFTIAFMVIWVVGWYLITPRLVTSAMMTNAKEPTLEHPREAQVAEPDPSLAIAESKPFSFFKDSGERMAVPTGGGLLAMAAIPSAKGATRPSTYQLWLTESQLWQIRTTEEKAEIEELPHPKDAGIDYLDQLMREKVGFRSGGGTTTISAETVASLKSAGNSWRDDTMNGKLKISVEGVVFIIPNPYGS